MKNFKTFLTRSRYASPARSALCLKYACASCGGAGAKGEKGIRLLNVLSYQKAKNWNSLLVRPFEFLVQVC